MGNESSSPKKLFEQLDQTRDGFLTLDDLHLTLGKAVDCPLTESPLMLYKFDTGQDGALGREEFEKYMKKIDKLSKLTEKKKKKILNKLKRAYNEEMQERQCWVTLDETTASLLDFSRDSETPALIGASPNSYEPHPFEENIDLVDLKKKKYLKHVLERVELRSMYMQWLFRLADVDGDGDLELEELELILKALEQDGIQTKNLSFEKKEGMSVAQSLLDEYDHDKTGFVTKAEFMVLADLIMRHYEAQSTQKNKGRIGKYVLQRKLGVGSNSVVRVGVDQETGKKYAIKIIKRGDVSDMSRVDTELKAMIMLNHPSIVNLFQVLENSKYVYFVMELCGGGSLANHLMRGRPFSEQVTRWYMTQLVKGLKYCHKEGVCHRDLKLENLVIDNSGHLKITDFGHAGIYRKGWDLFSTGCVGSLYHVSPEQIQGKCYSGTKMDIWGVGIILYRLLVGKPPFYSENTQEMFEKIKTATYEVPDNLSPEVIDLIGRILQTNPEDRPTCHRILKHEWFQGPTKRAKMAVHVMRLDSSYPSPEITWKKMCFYAHKAGLHVLHATPAKKHHICMIKCSDTQRDLKFSITMKKTKYREYPYIEFNLGEGEAWDFSEMVHKLMHKIRQRFIKKKKIEESSSSSEGEWSMPIEFSKPIDINPDSSSAISKLSKSPEKKFGFSPKRAQPCELSPIMARRKSESRANCELGTAVKEKSMEKKKTTFKQAIKKKIKINHSSSSSSSSSSDDEKQPRFWRKKNTRPAKSEDQLAYPELFSVSPPKKSFQKKELKKEPNKKENKQRKGTKKGNKPDIWDLPAGEPELVRSLDGRKWSKESCDIPTLELNSSKAKPKLPKNQFTSSLDSIFTDGSDLGTKTGSKLKGSKGAKSHLANGSKVRSPHKHANDREKKK